MREVLTVLTFKSAQHIVADGGTQSWVVSPSRVRRCTYVVCVRHQQGPYKAEGHEPHKHAFLVGKVSGVVPSDETPDRYKVMISEYAVLNNGPSIPLKSASPTQYFPSLNSIEIDEAALEWKPVSELPTESTGTSRAITVGSADHHQVEEDGEDASAIPVMSVFMQAKKLVADAFHIPLSQVEITVRA